MIEIDAENMEEKITLREKLEQEVSDKIQLGDVIIYMSFNPKGKILNDHLVDYFGRLKSQ